MDGCVREVEGFTGLRKPELIAKIKSVLMGMVNDEEGRAALKTVKMASMPELTDADFDPLRKILAKKQELKNKN